MRLIAILIILSVIGMTLVPLYEPALFISLVVFAAAWFALFVTTVKRINEH